MSILAAKAGKDVCCEKPLNLSIREGRLVADAMKTYGRVFRTDSEFRSQTPYHRVCELVRNGRIGTLHTIRTGCPQELFGDESSPDMPVPPTLDYDMWLGPARKRLIPSIASTLSRTSQDGQAGCAFGTPATA
jgi:hypothetical protein